MAAPGQRRIEIRIVLNASMNEELRALAKQHQPKLIVAGASA